jgi:hypothetical protein
VLVLPLCELGTVIISAFHRVQPLRGAEVSATEWTPVYSIRRWLPRNDLSIAIGYTGNRGRHPDSLQRRANEDVMAVSSEAAFSSMESVNDGSYVRHHSP